MRPKETVRPTAFHKFYSETRAQWLSAEDLQPGERLRGLTGPLQVVSQRPIPGTHRVYNMTVEGDHVDHVSTLGVLAHNANCTLKPGSAAHKAQRWQKYSARRGKWKYEHWSRNYDANMTRVRLANAQMDAYHNRIGWVKREVTVYDAAGNARRLDIADIATQRAIEHKTGYTCLTEDILWEVQRDAALIKDG